MVTRRSGEVRWGVPSAAGRWRIGPSAPKPGMLLASGHVPCSVVPNPNTDSRASRTSPSAQSTYALNHVQRRAVGELLRVSPVADDLARRFQAAGYALALVGGSVRDALLGRLGNDLDFTTDARPEDVLGIVRPWADAVWEVGIAFGTIGCRRGDFHIEITT